MNFAKLPTNIARVLYSISLVLIANILWVADANYEEHF